MLLHRIFRTALIVFGLLACKRDPNPAPARHPLPTTQPATPTPAAPQLVAPAREDAPGAGLPPAVITSATCSEETLAAQLGPALESGAEIVCRPEDGGTGFTIPPHANRTRRRSMAMATIVARHIRSMDERGRRDELRTMDRESRSDPARYATPGLIMRNPDRTRGKLVILEGVAMNVRERDGVTSMRVIADIAARERFEVVLPVVADEGVVSGGRVRVYGIHVDTEQVHSAMHGDIDQPIIYAVAIVALDAP